MNLKKFDNSMAILIAKFRTGFFKEEKNGFQANVYYKIADYPSQIHVIVERLDDEIKHQKILQDYMFDCMKKEQEIGDDAPKKWVINMNRITLDISDFYIYTRIFLDSLTVGIKLSFKHAGNKNADIMKEKLRYLISKSYMDRYKEKIDFKFFSNLEKTITWIPAFRDCRDGLVHDCHYLVFTPNRQGDLGYDVIEKFGKEWGTDTVKGILTDIEKMIDNLIELTDFLSINLPTSNNTNTPTH